MAAVELGRAAPGGRPLLPKLPGAPAEVPSTPVPLTAALYAVEPAHTETVMCSEKQLKRGYRPSKNLPRPKRARVECRRERREDEQRQDLAMVLCQLEEDFAEKERLSQGSAWCTPIPFERKITTVRDFYDAFHNTETLPIWTCRICYRKFGKDELEGISLVNWVSFRVSASGGSPSFCQKCFAVDKNISACADCISHLGKGGVFSSSPTAWSLGL